MKQQGRKAGRECPHCGEAVGADAIICPHCVGPLPKPEGQDDAGDATTEVPQAPEAEPVAPSAIIPSEFGDEDEDVEEEPEDEATEPSLPIPASEEPAADADHLKPAPPPPPPSAPPTAQPAYQPVAPPQQFGNAPFWPRVAAMIIDGLVLMVPIGLLIGVQFVLEEAGGISEEDPLAVGLTLLSQLLMVLVQVGYHTIMNGAYGATLGKMALGMRVVRADGTPIGYGLALGRILLQMVLGNCTCSLFYISVATNDEYRGWHDQIVGTRVIYVR